MTVSKLTAPLVAQAARLTGALFPHENWSQQDLHAAITDENRTFFVATVQGCLAGCAGLQQVGEQGDVLTVGVDPAYRRQGIGAALLDALVRGEIHYLDEAESYRELLGSGEWNTQQLAERIGRTPATLRRKLRLTHLGEEVAQGLRENGLCERYAQALLRVPGLEGRLKILRHVTDGGLSVKETEQLIDELLSRMPVPMTGGRRMKPIMRDYRLYVNAIRGIVEQMCDAGLDAGMQLSVGRNVAEVRVTIPIFLKRQGPSAG